MSGLNRRRRGSRILAVGALLDAYVVSNVLLAVGVVPEVIPEVLEDDVPVLHEGQAVLAVEVVGLVVSPIKPLDSHVSVGPQPVAVDVVVVVLLRDGSQPEKVAPGHAGLGQARRLTIWSVLLNQLRLQPVVQADLVDLGDETLVAGTEDVGVRLGDLLHGEHEAVAATMVFVPLPAVGAVVGVLAAGQAGGQGEKEG